MARKRGEFEGPTRREFLTSGGAVVGGSLLAGCTGGGNDESKVCRQTSSRGHRSATACGLGGSPTREHWGHRM
ncbi:MAG: hypothetical protein IH933_00085 [Euryarchaeota archaeon]|nr:hypothetical protein [Euryarchaeota archaeon]